MVEPAPHLRLRSRTRISPPAGGYALTAGNAAAGQGGGACPSLLHRLGLGLSRWLLCALLLALPLAAGAREGTDLVPVTLALQWKPQSQFAGYYLARDHGYYREAGLDVTFVHANTDRGSLMILTAGEAQLATAALTDALLLAPRLVQIAQLVRRDSNLIIGWKDMGILRVEDLDGKPVSYWQGVSSIFEAFFTLHDIRPIPIPQYYSINLFLERGVAACAAKEYNDLHRLFQAGIDLDQVSVFKIRDYGLGFPEDGLYAEAGWAGRHPELLAPLRQATLKGWRYAQAHPEEAIAVVMAEARQARVPTNLPHEQWMLRHLLESIFIPGEDPAVAGSLEVTAFREAAATLQAAGLLREAPDVARFAPLEDRTRD